MKKKLGFLVNPVAGIGGRVGLKGSDGSGTIKKALEMGAVPVSPARAAEALKRLAGIMDSIGIFACPAEMGEYEALECGFRPVVVGSIKSGATTAGDTREAAAIMAGLGVDLLLFAGGDGTARDICSAVGTKIPVLGIPAGVKMHSAVFATNPRNAGDLAAAHLQSQAGLREAEVMDIDEEAFREGVVSARLYGYLRVPYEKNLVQNLKSGSPGGEDAELESIARRVVDGMRDDFLYVIGPGTTTRKIMDLLGLENTLLGVDVVSRGRLVAGDADEGRLLKLIGGRRAKIIVTPIGGQGYLFGRGNQQISPGVISLAGRENIMIIATKSKLASLRGSPLLADTGDNGVNAMLAGYHRVITGYNEDVVYRVEY